MFKCWATFVRVCACEVSEICSDKIYFFLSSCSNTHCTSIDNICDIWYGDSLYQMISRHFLYQQKWWCYAILVALSFSFLFDCLIDVVCSRHTSSFFNLWFARPNYHTEANPCSLVSGVGGIVHQVDSIGEIIAFNICAVYPLRLQRKKIVKIKSHHPF